MFSGLLQKDPFKERGSSAEKFFEQNYFHTQGMPSSFLSRTVA